MTCRAILLGSFLATFSFSQTPAQQSKLPECPHSPKSYWDHCRGIRLEANGAEYVGEFRDGKFNGQGTERSPNGNVYVGEFRDDKFNGQGTLTFSNGYKYAGEFRNGQPNGQGTATYGNGYKYVGEFRDGQPNGQGTFTLSDGTKQIGQFRDGHYMGPSTSPVPTPTPSAVGPSAVPAPKGPDTTFEVALQKRMGVLFVPVLINDKIPLDFILDTGATDVSIPSNVVVALMRTGTLTQADFTGTATYLLADGTRMPSQTFRIRSLKVGDRVLQNVAGSVASANGSLLLGQSFLSRFKSWSIDNARQVLVLQ